MTRRHPMFFTEHDRIPVSSCPFYRYRIPRVNPYFKQTVENEALASPRVIEKTITHIKPFYVGFSCQQPQRERGTQFIHTSIYLSIYIYQLWWHVFRVISFENISLFQRNFSYFTHTWCAKANARLLSPITFSRMDNWSTPIITLIEPNASSYFIEPNSKTAFSHIILLGLKANKP